MINEYYMEDGICKVRPVQYNECTTALNTLKEQIGGSHYEDMKIQPIEFILENNLSFLEGNILKYICRYKSKNGLQDLLKARHYLDILIEHEQRRTKSGDSETGSGTSNTLPTT